MSLLHALALAFAASAQVEAATHPRAFMTGGRKLTLEDLAEECERRGLGEEAIAKILETAALRLASGEDMHAVYWSLVPATPVPVQSFERARREPKVPIVYGEPWPGCHLLNPPTPVRPKPAPRYRCPKCEATADTPKRCRACNVKMTSRKR